MENLSTVIFAIIYSYCNESEILNLYRIYNKWEEKYSKMIKFNCDECIKFLPHSICEYHFIKDNLNFDIRYLIILKSWTNKYKYWDIVLLTEFNFITDEIFCNNIIMSYLDKNEINKLIKPLLIGYNLVNFINHDNWYKEHNNGIICEFEDIYELDNLYNCGIIKYLYSDYQDELKNMYSECVNELEDIYSSLDNITPSNIKNLIESDFIKILFF